MTTPSFTLAHASDRISPARKAASISIALCTYNGARFLKAQLDSFLAQTRLPDELVVCDDGSTDDTLVILEEFEEHAPFPIRIFRNEQRLGSTKNFEKAIGLCTGDLVATSDQDDVWLPEKLALSEAALDSEPGRGFVFTNADVVDEELNPVGYTMWDAIHFGLAARWRVRRGHAFKVLLQQWVVTGATMMFRSEYRPFILPIPENWIHDGWIAFIIGALAPAGFVERSTVQYRQHSAQQIGGKKLTWRELYRKAREVGPPHFRQAYERSLLVQERLQRLAPHLRDVGLLSLIAGKVDHQRRRLMIAEMSSRWGRVACSLGELLRGGYWRYSSPACSHFLKDLIL
jgi:glycosyltransferase involved in cell wall biosynthesis